MFNNATPHIATPDEPNRNAIQNLAQKQQAFEDFQAQHPGSIPIHDLAFLGRLEYEELYGNPQSGSLHGNQRLQTGAPTSTTYLATDHSEQSHCRVNAPQYKVSDSR